MVIQILKKFHLLFFLMFYTRHMNLSPLQTPDVCTQTTGNSGSFLRHAVWAALEASFSNSPRWVSLEIEGSFPIGSMYGISTYIWWIFMVNVGKCTSPMGYGFLHSKKNAGKIPGFLRIFHPWSWTLHHQVSFKSPNTPHRIHWTGIHVPYKSTKCG